MKKITKGIIIVLVFIVMAALVTGYLTNEMQWVGVRRTGETNDSVIPISVKGNAPLGINRSKYIFEEWTTSTRNWIYKTPIQGAIFGNPSLLFFSVPLIPWTDKTFNGLGSDCTTIYNLEYYEPSNDSYINITLDTVLIPKKGYRINISSGCDFTLTGNTFTIDGIDMEEGWNLIAGPSFDYNFPISSSGTCSITGGPWYYQDGWTRTNTLEEGKAYLIQVASACELGISDNFNGKMKQLIIRPLNLTETYSFKLEDSSFIIYDGTDRNYTGTQIVRRNIPLIGQITPIILYTTDDSSTASNFSIKIVYK